MDILNENDIYLFNTGNAQRAYMLFGCRYIPEKKAHRFVLWAPGADRVSVVGDFNCWDKNACVMQKVHSGIFFAFVHGAKEGDCYKYHIESRGKCFFKADPFAFYSETDGKTASRVWDTFDFDWTDREYLTERKNSLPQKHPINIYEVHLGSWKDLHDGINYRSLADSLADYCTYMGYTHIEIMPVTEYPYHASWGYQVTGYFCPTARYGTPTDFMYFVNRLHKSGIGVIMDWVPAHFPRDAHGLSMFDGTCLYEYAHPLKREHKEWGTLVFDYGKNQVQSFLISSAMYFFDVFHIDGIRVDAVSSMLYLDYGRQAGEYALNNDGGIINTEAVSFLRKLNSAILSTYKGCITAAEESTAFPCVTLPPYCGGLGFTFKWDMGFMHDTLEYMSMDHFFRQFNHNKLTFSMMYAFSENFILPYSHDEVTYGKGSMLSKMFGQSDEKFAALRALYGYVFAHPGKKLTFMGSEIGQLWEWDHKSFVHWHLLSTPMHQKMQNFCRDLNHFYKNTPAFFNPKEGWEGFLWLNVNNFSQSAAAFMLTGENEQKIICACNFTPVTVKNMLIGLPQKGRLSLIFNSDSTEYGGQGEYVKKLVFSQNRPFQELPCSASVTLPPLSTIYYKYEAEEDKQCLQEKNVLP